MKKKMVDCYVRAVALCALLCLLVGCSGTRLGGVYSTGPAEKSCAAQFLVNDKQISAAGVADAQYARVAGFPYLRITRLYATLKSRLADEVSREAWISELGTLDEIARTIENRNMGSSSAVSNFSATQFNRCRKRLVADVLANPLTFERLLKAATVPDNYRWQHRLVGLYAFSRWPVYYGVKRLQAHETPRDQLTSMSNLRHYLSASGQNFTPRQPADGLGFPRITNSTLLKLLDRYEPIWSIESHSRADHVGELVWSGGRIKVNTQRPSVYRDISHTVFEENVLLQLNYTIWLPAVEATNPIDIYAGEVDGLTFRVTLDESLKPIYVDVMHNCGCYYMAFPSPSLEPSTQTGPIAMEPLWVPYSLPTLHDDQRYQLIVDTGKHFVRSFRATAAPTGLIKLIRQPYDLLRRLPAGEGQTRSAFSPRAVIENSERLERMVLWPMGVVSAGAMRQAGNHAIAFVGRRHFDDVDLISKNFRRRLEK
ncbi:MAG: hypothetical protein ACU84Q_08880 [Gammaproteobacteria bacterium]